MKRIALAVALALTIGCVGSATPHNPMTRKSTTEPWWQATTADVNSLDNPWEIYVRPNPLLVSDDPWSTYEAPPLFPEGWKPAKVTTSQSELMSLRKQLKVIKLRQCLRLEKLKKQRREKRRLEKLRKRSIINPHKGRTY